MNVETTKNGINYEWGLAGPIGLQVNLYPVKGVNSQSEIVEAKKQLREDLNVSIVEVYWTTKEEAVEIEKQIPEVLKKKTIVQHELIEE